MNLVNRICWWLAWRRIFCAVGQLRRNIDRSLAVEVAVAIAAFKAAVLAEKPTNDEFRSLCANLPEVAKAIAAGLRSDESVLTPKQLNAAMRTTT